MTRRDPWYESDNPSRVARGMTWRAAVWIVVAILFVGAVSVGIWAFSVATSDVKGRGDATRQINAADNRLFQQTNFVQLYNDVISYDQRLDQAARDKAEHPGDGFYATNYTGLVNQCISTRNDYNAQAQKITAAKFRDESLPPSLDPSDPRFDCHEAADAVPTPTGSSK